MTVYTGACSGIARGGGNISTLSGPCVGGTTTPPARREVCETRGSGGMLPRGNFENRVIFLYSGAF